MTEAAAVLGAAADAPMRSNLGKSTGMKNGGSIVREQLVALYELQQIDSKVLEFERSAAAIPQKIAALEAELEGTRAELGALHAEVDERVAQQKEIEGQISEETAKHHKWRRRLTEIKTPREYQAMSRELEIGERQVREFEETVLQLLQEIDDRRGVLEDKEATFQSQEGQALEKIKELRTAEARLKEEAEAASTGREALMAKLPEAVVRRYKHIGKARQGLSVVLAEGGACAGCNMQLRPQQVVNLLKGNSVEQCPGCQRLLVHPDLLAQAKD